jgi:DNA modification methylase
MNMMQIVVEQIERRALDQLMAFAGNARTHSPQQVNQIAESISEFGFVNPILIGSDDVIVAGHARLLAAMQLGMTHVPVIVLGHLTDTQRRALVIADNQLALNAGWDEAALQRELDALENEDFPMRLTGFSDEELERWLSSDDASAGLTDEDDVPEVAQTPVTVTGDLWILGNHRLLCGDALATADVTRLMAGEQADLIVTDLPYNIDYTGHTCDQLKIIGDHLGPAEFRQFLSGAFRSYRQIVRPGASLYVCHPSSWQREFQEAMEGAGFVVRCQIIWAKNTFAWGFGRYKFQHEPIFYGHVAGQKDAWYGDKSQSTLWEENKPSANREHPTAKPVGLLERALINSSRKQDVIADLFGGSGSAMIACERQRRVCRLMEIDPRYVDVAVRRWQQHTGQTAHLDGDGRSFQEIASIRQPGVVEEGAPEGGGL